MSCRPKCGGFKVINISSELKLPMVVSEVGTNNDKLLITNTDNTSYEVELPKAPPANLNFINVLNASGTQTVAIVATKKED